MLAAPRSATNGAVRAVAGSGFLTVWLWLLALGLAVARPAVLEAERESLLPMPHVSLLRDPGGLLSLPEVLAADFEKVETEHLHRGFDRAAYWLKVPLVSGDPVAGDWLIELGHTRFELLDWFVVKDGRELRHVAMGNRRPRDPAAMPGRFPVLNLPLEAGERIDLYLRVQTSTQVRIALRAFTPLAYAARHDVAGSVYLACFGAMAVLGAIGLIYGLSTGFRGAFAYAASALTTGLIFLGTSGYWVLLGLPGAAFGANEGVAVFNALTQIAILAYVRAFFELRERMPRVDLVAKAGIAAGLLLLAAMTVISYQAMLKAANLYAAAVALFSVTSAVLAMVRGMKIARIYLLAWLPFWVSNLVHLLSLWRVIETRENPEHRVVALAVVSATLFFLAMADRTRQHRRERDVAQARLLEKERDENHRLEVLVEERTTGLLAAKEQAERAKEMFLANISHEIRTPLSALVGLSQAMCKQSERRQLAEDFVRMLRQIRSGGRHLNLMLTNLLDLSSLNAGRPAVKKSPVDLAAWSRSVRDIVEPFAAAKGLELRWHDGAIDGAMLSCDPLRLSQVLINLVHNAIKFTPQGAVEVSFALDGPRFSFEVLDDGPGLPGGHQALFGAFEQNVATPSGPESGVGLGLYLVQRHLAETGGRIHAATSPSGGAAFRVELEPAF